MAKGKEDSGFITKSKNMSKNEEKIKQGEEELEQLLKESEEEQNQTDDENQEEQETEDKKAKATGEEATWKKRYGDLRRVETGLREDVKTLKSEIEILKKAKNDTSDIPTNREEVDEWMSKNPEAAGLIKMIASEMAETKMEGLSEKMESLEVSQETVKREKSEARIMKSHPDFEDIIENDAFHDWVESQPKFLQDAVYGTDPDSVIWSLNEYKKTLKKEKKKDTSAAEAVDTKSSTSVDVKAEKGKIKESDVEKWSAEEFAEREDEVNKAIAEGKFIYDMSGAAR